MLRLNNEVVLDELLATAGIVIDLVHFLVIYARLRLVLVVDQDKSVLLIDTSRVLIVLAPESFAILALVTANKIANILDVGDLSIFDLLEPVLA
jgi:hypothetical protein